MDFYGKKISDHIIRLKQEGVLTDYQGPKKGTIYQILAFHPDCPLPPVNHKYNLLMICSESDDMVVSQAGRHILSLISKGISSFRSTDLTEALKISSFQVGGVIRWLKAAEIIEDKCFLRIIHFPYITIDSTGEIKEKLLFEFKRINGKVAYIYQIEGDEGWKKLKKRLHNNVLYFVGKSLKY